MRPTRSGQIEAAAVIGLSQSHNNVPNKVHIQTLPDTPSADTAILSIKQKRKRVYCRLKSFELIPKLPTEVRLRIWRFAIGRRNTNQVLLPVTMSLNPTVSPQEPRCLFTIETTWKGRYQEWARGILTKNGGKFVVSGLSMACFESREIFLKALPSTLSTPTGGLIRYNPGNTIIQITKPRLLLVKNAPSPFSPIRHTVDAVAEDAKRSLWPVEVQHLGLGASEQSFSHMGFIKPMNLHNTMPNLKNIVALSLFDIDSNAPWWDSLGSSQHIQNHLDDWEGKIAGYKPPKFSVVNKEMIVLEVADCYSDNRSLELCLEKLEKDVKELEEMPSNTNTVVL